MALAQGPEAADRPGVGSLQGVREEGWVEGREEAQEDGGGAAEGFEGWLVEVGEDLEEEFDREGEEEWG